jgi:hypothetical protein
MQSSFHTFYDSTVYCMKRRANTEYIFKNTDFEEKPEVLVISDIDELKDLSLNVEQFVSHPEASASRKKKH